MSGWSRLKIVLSVLYWGVVGLGVFMIGRSNEQAALFPPTWQMPIWPLIVGAVIVYTVVVCLWWAFEGFGRRA